MGIDIHQRGYLTTIPGHKLEYLLKAIISTSVINILVSKLHKVLTNTVLTNIFLFDF